MEKIILSLKNLYKILLTNDFPIYSESVIGEKNRKGQTVLRFWQQQIIPEFKSLPYGKMIWRNDGKRNRYTSHLCNRNTELKLYGEYAKELAAKTSISALLNQIERFMDFLSAREYRHDILLRRIREMVRLCQAEDPRLTREIAAQINDNCGEYEWLSRYGVQGNLFQAGYLLTMMSLYAAAGEAMDDPVLAVLREDAYHMDALWEARTVQQERQRSAAVFLTNHAGLLQDAPLPQNRFFGREEELYDLLEMVQAQRKCLISGIGGIGKTELLRQLIRQCSAEHTVDKLAIVPYENGIVESFARAFPNFLRQDPEESFHSILHQMAQAAEGGERLLLVIDDLTAGLQEDPALAQLANLPCGVLITSRQSSLEGFEVYRMTAPAVSTGALIFRDNFGRPLTREDRELLKELLRSETLCHPLTLRMLARAAGSKLWSVTQLKEHLQEHNIALTWTEEDRTVRLSQMYHQLYSFSGIPDSCHSLIELFTVLPSGSYCKAFLEELMGGAALPEMDLLVRGGWLDETDSGWHMHPLIAQCLRRKILTEAKLSGLLGHIQKRLPKNQTLQELRSWDQPLHELGSILLHISGFLTGSISRELLLDIACAAGSILATTHVKQRLSGLLPQLFSRCTQPDDFAAACYLRVLHNWDITGTQTGDALYQRQKAAPTLPRWLFLDLCLHAGRYYIGRNNDLAQAMLEDVLAADASPDQHLLAYNYLSRYWRTCGKLEKSRECAKLALEFVAVHPESSHEPRFETYAEMCASNIEFGQLDAATELLKTVKSLIRENRPTHYLRYIALAGNIAHRRGELDQAMEYFTEALQIHEEFLGKNARYYDYLNNIAIICHRQKRYKEAREHLLTCLSFSKSVNSMMGVLLYNNNIAALCLDMRQPEEALTHLSEALSLAEKSGGVVLGEVLRNFAKAYHMLGDTAREYDSYKRACPLLEAAYGPEHPRCAPCLQRLKELQGQV